MARTSNEIQLRSDEMEHIQTQEAPTARRDDGDESKGMLVAPLTMDGASRGHGTGRAGNCAPRRWLLGTELRRPGIDRELPPSLSDPALPASVRAPLPFYLHQSLPPPPPFAPRQLSCPRYVMTPVPFPPL
ncbi:unnamed protein product, partial [Iphiclides podalirius]